MATKDISDVQVLRAYVASRATFDDELTKWPYDILQEETGLSFKECWAACERACYKRDLIEYGVSLRTGWLTPKGEALLREHQEGA